MDYTFGFKDVKINFYTGLNFIQHPIKFYAANKDNDESLIDFMRSMLLISILINSVVSVFQNIDFLTAILSGLLGILLSYPIVYLSLVILSFIYNFTIKIFLGKDNIMAARRAIAFTSVTILIPNIYILVAIGSILNLVLYTIGISKQYKISYTKAFLITLLPWVIIIGV